MKNSDFFILAGGVGVYVVREMRMPGCWREGYGHLYESQGWRRRSYSLRNARSFTLYAALLTPGLSTYLTLLKDKFSLVNYTELCL